MRKRLACVHCLARIKAKKRYCPSCGKAMVRVLDNRFEQRQRLMAQLECVTVHVWDRVDRQDAVVRLLAPAAGNAARDALETEGRVLLEFAGEPGFPDLIHAGHLSATGAPYTVQTHIVGVPLAKALRKASPARIVELFIEALKPVAVLHAAGYVHCALALNHILVTPHGEVVRLDHRQARPAGSRSGGSGVPGYKAPEQTVPSRPVTQATDVFASAVCLYVLLTRKWPYGRKGRVCAGHLPKSPSAWNRKVTPDLDEILLQALAPDPGARFVSAVELLDSLSRGFGTATVVDRSGLAFPGAWQKIGQAVLKAATTVVQGPFVAAARTMAALCRAIAAKPLRTVAAVCVLATSAVLFRYLAALSPGAGNAAKPQPPAESQLLNDISDALALTPVDAPGHEHATIGRVQFLTWPPADVYIDGQFIVQAPSPERFTISGGIHRVTLVSKWDEQRIASFDVEPGMEYVVKFNFDSGLFETEQVDP